MPHPARVWRIVTVVLLVLTGLFYLQFGLQALAHHMTQGALALVASVALFWGAANRARGKEAAGIVILGTVPILALHLVMTVEDAGELPFLLGSIPVPVLAAASLVRSRAVVAG